MNEPAHYLIGEAARMELVLGNIVHETTDAIVNAANSSLLGGGGVDGAIHAAAGPTLLDECRKIHDQRGPLPAGQAVATRAGNLKVRYVIHTVGPVWYGGERNEPQILESSYCNSIGEALRLNCTSLSFPSVSTGVFGYSVDLAAQVAVRTVADLLQSPRSLVLVRFVLFDPRTHKAYAAAMNKLRQNYSHLKITSEAN